MLNRLKYLILGSMLAVALGFYYPADEGGEDSKKDEVILSTIYNTLNSYHFAPQQINDQFSAVVFEKFIENLDYSKRFLLEEDLAQLEKSRSQLDDQFRNSSLAFFEEAYPLYLKRYENARGFYKDILAEPFDFEIDETFETDEEKMDFAQNEAELKDRWRKYLKQRTLARIEEKMHEQENPDEKMDSTKVEEMVEEEKEPKTFAELEKTAREKELELHDDWFDNLDDMERIDWIGMYMNAFTEAYDPHTQYFPPQRKEDFEISMSGQLEGIGAQLQQKGEYVTISKIIIGSACWKQGDLEEGDKITKVRQEDQTEDEAVDMVGMSVRKAVNFIRGPKGTTVILTVQKMDGSKQIIPIVRDVVELEATFAKSAILGEGNDKVGYIRLPKFYVDFYNQSNRNCADDVKQEIQNLKKDGVKSIVLDLRNNGGGSLQGVIDIVGLFIEEGPVVQVVAPNKAPKVLNDKDSEVYWDGPLVVMVNQFSASASEIFAAAIQDYERGIIIGSKSTFGKGTVQNVVDMDRAVGLSNYKMKPFGALKLTIQKYYRINGGTPQLEGVHPEIVLPDNYNYIAFGEKESDNALAYDEIKPANYQHWKKGVSQFDNAVANSKKRVAASPKFSLIDEYAQWLKDEREETEISLNYDQYHAEQEEFRTKSKRYDGMRKADDNITVSEVAADHSKWDENEQKRDERDRWFKGLQKDLYLQEAMMVAGDL